MTKLLSISISFIILIQSFGISFYDLLRLDAFIEHAQFHSEQHGDNVFVFISKHYGELKLDHEKKYHKEKEEHEQLPFNHNNCSHVLSLATFILSSFKSELKIVDFQEGIEANFFYRESRSSLHKLGLFQPPQHS